MAPKVTGNLSVTNYYDSKGNNETLNLVGINVPLWKGGSLSGGIGCDVQYNNQNNTSVQKPALELKLKQNIGEYANIQARFREIDGVEQYRIAFGANYKFDKSWSVYGAVHATAKDNGSMSYNTGVYVGVSYHDKKTGISVFAEGQQNIPLSTDASFGRTISSFNDGNKLINVGISIPLY